MFSRQLASSSPLEQCGVKSHTLLSSTHSPSPHWNHDGGQRGGGGALLSANTHVHNKTLVQVMGRHHSGIRGSYSWRRSLIGAIDVQVDSCQVILIIKRRSEEIRIDYYKWAQRGVSTFVVLREIRLNCAVMY